MTDYIPLQTKACSVCGLEKPIDEFYPRPNRRSGHFGYCDDCRKAKQREYQNANRDKHNARSKAYKARLRDQVLEAYGRTCVCCGEQRSEFLAVDHINGGGTQMRKNGYSSTAKIHLFLIQNNFPDDYRLLCHNCNCARGFYGYCPHERERGDA